MKEYLPLSTPNMQSMQIYASNIIPHLAGLSPANGKRVLDYVKTQLDSYAVIRSTPETEDEELDTA